ncbi:hypothetical protein EVAR_8113_1 [Eumeta japonica]|uniref:Uncharacterized protein n=1 Tax=Eumeta variegata TaxID=151549 RepID=A0A4C1TSQ3_EUMVA|nr:hypothetical protein EVAR_8113_1 [Eumeta japonica]
MAHTATPRSQSVKRKGVTQTQTESDNSEIYGALCVTATTSKIVSLKEHSHVLFVPFKGQIKTNRNANIIIDMSSTDSRNWLIENIKKHLPEIPLINDKEDTEKLNESCAIRVYTNYTTGEYIIVKGVYYPAYQNAEITNEAEELIRRRRRSDHWKPQPEHEREQ